MSASIRRPAASTCFGGRLGFVSRRRRRHRHSHCTTLVVFSRAAHIRVIVQRYVLPSRRQTSAASRGLLRLGCPRLLQRLWLADNSPAVCFSHAQTQPTNKGRQPAGSLRDRRWAACRTSRSPSQRAGRHGVANGARPAASARLFCAWLRLRPTTGLHLADRVAWFAHEAPRPAWHSPTPSAPPHRLRLTLAQAPSSSFALHVAAWVDLLADECVCRYGCANSVSHTRRLALARCAVGRRRPLQHSEVAGFGRHCRCAAVRSGCLCYRKWHPAPPPASLATLLLPQIQRRSLASRVAVDAV